MTHECSSEDVGLVGTSNQMPVHINWVAQMEMTRLRFFLSSRFNQVKLSKCPCFLVEDKRF